MEPELQCQSALFSPWTGIVDSHSFMLSMQGELEDAGGAVAVSSPLVSCDVADDDASASGRTSSSGRVMSVSTGGENPMEGLQCDLLVNCGGLLAPWVADLVDGALERHGKGGGNGERFRPSPHFAKGNYFKLSTGASPFSRLIYPVPEKNTAGLGTHATIDLAGQTRFGPDVEWIDVPRGEVERILRRDGDDDGEGRVAHRKLFEVDPCRSESMYEAVRRYWVGL